MRIAAGLPVDWLSIMAEITDHELVEGLVKPAKRVVSFDMCVQFF